MSANLIPTNRGGLLPGPGPGGPGIPWDRRQSREWQWALAAVTLALAWAYAPNFLELSTLWASNSDYSHGYLVIPIAVVILWRRLSEMPWEPSRDAILAPWWGWVGLAAILVGRAIAYERESQWTETATLLPATACLAWAFGGWPMLRRTWPAIAFLIFMLPLPGVINELIALPLQQLATTSSCVLLQLSGIWVVQDGNILQLTTRHGVELVDVARACNGLRMLMCMAATITAMVIWMPLPRWKRITLLVSTVPIALISNMIRIVATGWCYYFFAGKSAKELAHDWSGYLMMPVGLMLAGLELGILSWLIPQEKAAEDARKTILPRLIEPTRVKKKSDNRDLNELE
jgi:exosortase